MIQQNFKDLRKLCLKHKDKKYIPEILEILQNEECLFSPGILMSRDHVLNTYKIRLSIAKGNKNFTEEAIENFTELIQNMENFDNAETGIMSVAVKETHSMLFYDPKTETLFGVLELKRHESIINLELQQSELVEKGFSSSYQKFSNGEFVRDWK